MENIRRLVDGDNYEQLLKKVQAVKEIDINKSDLPTALLNYDAARVKAAKITANDLNDLIAQDIDSVTRFAILKMKYTFDEKEEHPAGEEIGDADKPKTIKILPYYKNFLVTALTEYYLLKFKSLELAGYLKITRISNAKKYEKELKAIFSKS